MKKPFAYLFLFVFAVQSLLIYPLGYILQQRIKNEMTRKVSSPKNGKTISFLFSKEEFNSLVSADGNEFSKKNILYDIVSVKQTANGKIAIQCLMDGKETLLVNNLANESKNNSERGKQTNEVQLILENNFTKAELQKTIFITRVYTFIENNFLYRSVIGDTEINPPRVV